MTKFKVQNKQELDKFYNETWQYVFDEEYPAKYPAIVVVHEEDTSCKDYLYFEFIYPEDFENLKHLTFEEFNY